MGLFDKVFGKKTGFGIGGRKTGSKNRTPKERLDALKASWLLEQKRKNRPRFDKIMQRELGYADDDDDSGGYVSRVKSGLEEWHEIREIVQSEAGNKGTLERAIESIGPHLGEILPAFMGQNQATQARDEELRQVLGQMAAKINQLEAAQIHPALSPPAPEPAPQAQAGGNVGLFDGIIAGVVIKNLEGRTPEQAAAWLLHQSTIYPQSAPFVQALCQTDDDQLPVMMASASQQFPQFAGVVNWLRQRPEWLVETVRAIRRQAGLIPEAEAAGNL